MQFLARLLQGIYIIYSSSLPSLFFQHPLRVYSCLSPKQLSFQLFGVFAVFSLPICSAERTISSLTENTKSGHHQLIFFSSIF